MAMCAKRQRRENIALPLGTKSAIPTAHCCVQVPVSYRNRKMNASPKIENRDTKASRFFLNCGIQALYEKLQNRMNLTCFMNKYSDSSKSFMSLFCSVVRASKDSKVSFVSKLSITE